MLGNEYATEEEMEAVCKKQIFGNISQLWKMAWIP